MYTEQPPQAPLECPQCGKKVLMQNGNFFKCLWCKFESSLDENPDGSVFWSFVLAILVMLLFI
ncbi:MAG: hypothetical protein WBA57_19355 [Elainellaceae cyanobacterium]